MKHLAYDDLKRTENELKEHYIHKKVKADRVFYTVFNDVHVGSLDFDEDSFRNTVKAIEKIPNFFVFLGGDSIDHANRGSKSNTMHQAIPSPRDQVLYFEELIAPIKDRILGKIDGNHDGTRAKEFNDIRPMEWFCDRNNIKYCGDLALVHFSVNKNAYTHFHHHITGSTGKKQNLNKLQEKGDEWRLDVIWGEHTHRRQHGSEIYMEIDLRNRKPIIREQYYINNNSFQSWGGYAKEKGYRIGKTGVKVVEMSGIHLKRNVRIYNNMNELLDTIS